MKNRFDTIDEAICEFIDRRSMRTTEKRGYDYWSASSLGKCKRYQVLCRAGVVTHGETNYSWKNAAQDGHSAHEWRQAALANVGILRSAELPIIDDELHFRGHYDFVIDLNGRLILGDIKTQNNRAFRARTRMPGRIDECHKRQLGAYFYFLKRDRYPNLAAARLYYVNKNTGEREEFEVYFEDGFFADIIKELKTLNHHWDIGILPKKEVSPFCKYICQFEPLCRAMLNRRDAKIKDAVQRSLSPTT